MTIPSKNIKTPQGRLSTKLTTFTSSNNTTFPLPISHQNILKKITLPKAPIKEQRLTNLMRLPPPWWTQLSRFLKTTKSVLENKPWETIFQTTLTTLTSILHPIQTKSNTTLLKGSKAQPGSQGTAPQWCPLWCSHSQQTLHHSIHPLIFPSTTIRKTLGTLKTSLLHT